jgi:hypothetical protein
LGQRLNPRVRREFGQHGCPRRLNVISPSVCERFAHLVADAREEAHENLGRNIEGVVRHSFGCDHRARVAPSADKVD